MRNLLCIFLGVLSFSTHSRYTGGVGYIEPGEYRVDNEINPLPLGISVVPMIVYRGERLRVLGPNISYALIKGAFSFSLRLNATGDRYKSKNLNQRDAAVNGGFSLRLLFLSIKYGSDIFNVYQGNTINTTIGWRFKLTESLFLLPSVGKEFLNDSYVNYYYGVSESEVGDYPKYKVGNAVNDLYRVGLTYILDSKHSVSINYSYKIFDNVIFDSPTINKKSFGSTSLFWNYNF